MGTSPDVDADAEEETKEANVDPHMSAPSLEAYAGEEDANMEAENFAQYFGSL